MLKRSRRECRENLIHLDLGHTRVSDVSGLARLRNLVHLDLFDTQVSDVSALARLTNLNRLELCYGKVYDMSPLYGLRNLRIFFDDYDSEDNEEFLIDY